MKVHTAIYYLSIIIVIMSLTGCGGSGSDTGNQEISNIQVNSANPIVLNSSTEDIPLDNCGGTGELSRSLSTETSIVQKIGISDKITVIAGGEAGAPVAIKGFPVDLKAKLEGEIEHTYQKTFESALSRLDGYTMKVAPQTSVTYVIYWDEQQYSSNITFDYAGARYEVPYTYIIKVPTGNDSNRNDCPASPSAPSQPNTNSSSQANSDTVCGESVSPESLARCIGGDAAYWTYRGPDVWGYWNKGHNVTFRHLGGGTILTYWAGFPEPRNAQGCQIVVVQSEDTKYVKCNNGGAEFEADGVGFHLVDHTSVFK